MSKKENDEKQKTKNIPEKFEDDDAFCLNFEKGSPLNPDPLNIRITEATGQDIEDIMKNSLVDMLFEERERSIEPFKEPLMQFIKTKMVAGQIQADNIPLKQLSASMKETIKKLNVDGVTVEEIPAKIILMRKNFNIIVPDGDPTDPNFKLGFSL